MTDHAASRTLPADPRRDLLLEGIPRTARISLAGACDWHVDWMRPAAAVEFLGRLRPGPASHADPEQIQRRRMSLLRDIARESIVHWESLLATQPSDRKAA